MLRQLLVADMGSAYQGHWVHIDLVIKSYSVQDEILAFTVTYWHREGDLALDTIIHQTPT